MVSKTVKIVNEQGFHMRPASVFSQEMAKFDSEIYLKGNGKTANGKSVMTLIASGFKCGTDITVECTGAEEEAQLAKAVEMIEAGLGD